MLHLGSLTGFTIHLAQPAWDVSERSQSDLHWERYLRDLSETSQKRCLFCDVFKTSQKHLKKDVFCVTSLSVSSISQKRCLFRDVSETSQKHLSQVFLVFQKYVTKMILCDFRRVIIISDKIDLGPSETLKKLSVLWEQCIDIDEVCPVGWYLRENFGKSKIVKTQQ